MPVTLPPAHGLASVKNVTYTAEGSMSYWSNYDAVTQMHGRGDFADQRVGVRITNSPDLVTAKLPALRAYQHAMTIPPTPGASFDRAAANRGWAVFDANCSRCHVAATLTDNTPRVAIAADGSTRMAQNGNQDGPAAGDSVAGLMHQPSETGMSGNYAARTALQAYRTTPLRALWSHAPYFHDGSAKTLGDVVEHYDRVLKLRLSEQQKKDLVQYLRSF
jgi:cytochrome c peroxidase